LWVLGAVAVDRLQPIRLALPVGGLLVASSQTIPVLHIFAGLLGVGAASVLGLASTDSDARQRMTEFGGFVATVVRYRRQTQFNV